MPQDSKTFSDIMDIDTSSSLKIVLEVSEQGNPKFNLTVNGQPVIRPLFIMYQGLLDPLEIKCIKTENGTVTIEKLSINDREVLPLYGIITSNQKHWIEETTWHLSIPSNFYQWYHDLSGQGWIA